MPFVEFEHIAQIPELAQDRWLFDKPKDFGFVVVITDIQQN